MFGVGIFELLALGLLAFMLFGEKLPEVTRDAARLLKQARAMADQATKGLRDELGPEYADLDVRDLHPKTLLKKHVVDAVWTDDDTASVLGAGAPAAQPAPSTRVPVGLRKDVVEPPPGAVPTFDPDAT
jgi:sec-independent protein translocase protein TatB